MSVACCDKAFTVISSGHGSFFVISSEAQPVHCHFERGAAESRNLGNNQKISPLAPLGRNDNKRNRHRSKGHTPCHSARSKGHTPCRFVLSKHNTFTVISVEAHHVPCHFERRERQRPQSRNLVGDAFMVVNQKISPLAPLGRNDTPKPANHERNLTCHRFPFRASR